MESQIACQASGSGSGTGGAVVWTRADVSGSRDVLLDGCSASESSEDEGTGSAGRGGASSSGNGGGSSSGRGGSSSNGGRGSSGRGGASGPSSSLAFRFRLAGMLTLQGRLVDQRNRERSFEPEVKYVG